MNLRPHHLLCIQKYTGHGYDAAFTAHMNAVTEQLRRDPQTQVTLVSGADTLCAVCPHQCGGVCDAQEKVTAMDRAVLKHGFTAQNGGAWAELAAAARTEILFTEVFHQICACCQWYDLCRQTAKSNGTNESNKVSVPHA